MNEEKGYNLKDASVLIMAGGESTRMGMPKLLLPFSDKKTFIEHLVERYIQSGIDQVVLVLNEKVYQQNLVFFDRISSRIQIVLNNKPELGRSRSLHLGLSVLNNNFVFIQNTDNPFVYGNILNEMYQISPQNGYVSPRFQGKGGHPVLISGDACDAIRVNAGHFILREILSHFKRVDFETDEPNILVNINTPDTYRQFFPNNHHIFSQEENFAYEN